MTTADVTIRGAGIFGLCCAWSCVSRGATVQVIDPFGPGAGSSGGIVGALSPHVPENWNDKKAFQLESLLMAERFWDAVDAASGLSSGYARCGRVQVVPDGGLALAEARAVSAADLWQGKAVWEVVPAGQDFGWSLPRTSGHLIHDTLSARVHPRRAVASLAAAVTARGGRVMQAGEDQGAVIWATGIAGLQELDPPGVGVKGQAALFDLDIRYHPQLYLDTLHVIPHEDGTTAVGSTSEREWADAGTDALLEDVIARAVAALPMLAGAKVIERWAGVRPRSRSRAPVLGPHPTRPGAFIANGGFKIGFGMAPLVGEVMADLVLSGVDRIPDGFRP